MIKMKEARLNIWDYRNNKDYYILITTNGSRRENGEAVMGVGVAAQAKKQYAGVAQILGNSIRDNGNVFIHLFNRLIAFPVKDRWQDKADINLIIKSAKCLADYATRVKPNITFLLPRPGCGAGGLNWEKVKPIIEKILPDNVIVVTTLKE
jgi:hypothetical protein